MNYGLMYFAINGGLSFDLFMWLQPLGPGVFLRSFKQKPHLWDLNCLVKQPVLIGYLPTIC